MTSPPFEFLTPAQFKVLSTDEKLRYVDRAMAATVDYQLLRDMTPDEQLNYLNLAMDAILNPLEKDPPG